MFCSSPVTTQPALADLSDEALQPRYPLFVVKIAPSLPQPTPLYETAQRSPYLQPSDFVMTSATGYQPPLSVLFPCTKITGRCEDRCVVGPPNPPTFQPFHSASFGTGKFDG